MRILRFGLIFIPAMLLAASADAPAADGLLDALPAHTYSVIRTKSPAALAAKLSGITGLPPSEIQQFTGSAFSDLAELASSEPQRLEIDPKGDWWTISIESDNGFESALALPATDVQKAKQAIDARLKNQDAAGGSRETLVVKQWILVVASEGILSTWNRFREKDQKSLGATIEPRMRARLDAGDVGMYFRMSRTTEDAPVASEDAPDLNWASRIFPLPAKVRADADAKKKGVAHVALGLGRLASMLNRLNGDSQGAAISLSISPQNIDVEGVLSVGASTPSQAFLQRQTPSEMRAMDRLPPNKAFYYGVAGDLSPVGRWLTELQLLGVPAKSAARGSLTAKAAALDRRKIEGYYGSFNFGKAVADPFEIVSISQTDQAAESVAFDREAAPPAADPERPGPAVETIAGHSVDRYTDKFAIDAPDASEKKDAANNAAPEIVLCSRYEARETSVAGLEVRTIGVGLEAMQRLLAANQQGSGAGAEKSWRAARAAAGDKINVLIMVDLPRFFFDLFHAGEAVHTLLGLDAETRTTLSPALTAPDPGREPSYCTLSLAVENGGIRMKLRVPFDQIQWIAPIYNLQQ